MGRFTNVDNLLLILLLVESAAIIILMTAIGMLITDTDNKLITASITFGSLLIAISQGADSKIYEGESLIAQI